MSVDHSTEPAESLKEWVICVLNDHKSGPPDASNLEKIITWADTQGVMALLYQKLIGGTSKSDLHHRFRDWNRQHTARAMMLQEERQCVLELLAPFQPVVLKGEALAYVCYENYHLRPMVDLDLLIDSANQTDIENTLTTAGYLPTNSVGGHLVMPQTSFVKKLAGEIHSVIDIHTALFNRPALRNLLSYRDLLDKAILSSRPPGMVPCPGHTLIHASLHLLAHHANNPRLIWFYDIKLLLNRLNPTENRVVTNFCRQHDLSALLLDAIDASLDAFPIEKPVPLIEALKEQAGLETATPFATGLKNNRTRSRRVAEDWNSLRGSQQRGAWLRQHLLPPPEYMLRKYSMASKWQLPFFYLWRILRGSVKLFASK